MSKEEKYVIKNEESCLPKGKREYLAFANEFFVPATVCENEDSFELTLNEEGLSRFDELIKNEGLEKYRLLIACAKLEHLRNEYSFSLNPENLMYDVNFIPKVKIRDAKKEEDDFINEYKALIGTFFSKKYSFDDYYLGGSDLFKNDNLLKKVNESDSIDVIINILYSEMSKLDSKLKKSHSLVTRRKLRILTVAVIILAVTTLASIGFISKYALTTLPMNMTAIEISNKYIAQDYIGVLEQIKKIEIEKLTDEQRYMAAYCGVLTGTLNDEQKKRIIDSLSLKTDSLILDYWTLIGIGKYSEAVDIAKRVGDIELELYSLILEKDSVEANMDISGSKKAEQINQIESQIKQIEEKIEAASMPEEEKE